MPSASHELVIGCVGKPSAGKSTFFNAVTSSLEVVRRNVRLADAESLGWEEGLRHEADSKFALSAKVGNFPFTTIEPNKGLGFFRSPCPCTQFDSCQAFSDGQRLGTVKCRPNQGACLSGTRLIQVHLLDVAGLIPGASEGLGLGNKFLDDLRHADVLLHIVDVSGTTNEKGEVTTNYDPVNDHQWLMTEVEVWIFNNLWSSWDTARRKYAAGLSATGEAIETSKNLVRGDGRPTTLRSVLQQQLSGYGADEKCISRLVAALSLTECRTKRSANKGTFKAIFNRRHRVGEVSSNDFLDLRLWDKEDVQSLVELFVTIRFPSVLVLNKADCKGIADKNSINISSIYEGKSEIVICSALAEHFLNKMCLQRYIDYSPGSPEFSCASDKTKQPDCGQSLKTPDDKLRCRLENIRDSVLYRHGSTGVHQAIEKAVVLSNLIPVYPIRNLKYLGGKRAKGNSGNNRDSHSSTTQKLATVDIEGAFPECVLVFPDTTTRQLAARLHSKIDHYYQYAEGLDGRRLGEDECFSAQMNVVRYVTSGAKRVE